MMYLAMAGPESNNQRGGSSDSCLCEKCDLTPTHESHFVEIVGG